MCFTPNNSAKNTIITAVSCLDELLSKLLTKTCFLYWAFVRKPIKKEKKEKNWKKLRKYKKRLSEVLRLSINCLSDVCLFIMQGNRFTFIWSICSFTLNTVCQSSNFSIPLRPKWDSSYSIMIQHGRQPRHMLAYCIFWVQVPFYDCGMSFHVSILHFHIIVLGSEL